MIRADCQGQNMDHIRTRRIPFEFPDDIEINSQARSFIEQEAQHFSQHRKFNELLKRKGYAELAEVEADMTDAYARLTEKPLQQRMAYTSGFETMTLGLTKWFVDNRQRLFGGADNRVVSVMLWHIVEEAEHKNVAINVYRAACPGYLPWAYGIFHGSGHVLYWAFRGAAVMLKRDGLWRKPSTQLRLARLMSSYLGTLLPIMVRALWPSHHPRRISDPAWVESWLAEFERSFPDHEGVPLLDTAHPDLPARFVAG